MTSTKNFFKNNFITTNKYFMMIYAFSATIITYLNFHSRAMEGLYKNYLLFKKIILSGFTYHPLITFPMWGYGWLLCVTENKIIILCIQQALAFLALWALIYHIEMFHLLPKKMVLIFKYIMIINIPWYAFHAVRWPNSITTTFIILGFIFLCRGTKSYTYRWFIASGILFGLALNFRSDYILIPIIFFCIIHVLKPTSQTKKGIFWISLIYILLTPWAFYTKKACDHYLLTSTNIGHVCFIGLGNDPNNPWGITSTDEDPLMQKIVKNKLGIDASTLTFQANTILKKEFLCRICKNPQAFIQKCLHVFYTTLIHGTYQGEFFEPQLLHKHIFKMRNKNIIKNLITDPSFLYRNVKSIIRVIFQRISYLIGKYIVFFGIIFSFFALIFALIQKNIFFTLSSVIVFCQIIINVLCSNQPRFMSNIILFLLLNILYTLSFLTNSYEHDKY